MRRLILPIICVGLGLLVLRLSLGAHARWQVYWAEGNTQLAKQYQAEFWPEYTIGIGLVILGAFLFGRRQRGGEG